jgi:hypothetical protein
VGVRPARGGPAELLADRCPGRGEATAVSTGRVVLDVAASAPWRLRLEQQVDTPLREPAPASVRDGRARRVGRGRFASLERRTRGTARLFRLPGGRLALRLEDFVTAASDDLFVWISPAHRRARTSREALRAPHLELGPLKATAGDLTYVLPRRLSMRDVRSVVIWCEPIRIAYGAAALR